MNALPTPLLLGLLVWHGALQSAVNPTTDLVRPDWPMFGGGPTRNAIRAHANPPTRWGLERVGEEVQPGFNVKWLARTGHGFAMASPVIANGYVWVGTNNETPRDSTQEQPASVLMCFRESDGAFVWQYVLPVQEGTRYDVYYTGIKCSPLVEGNRLWFTTQTAEVICLDIGSLLRAEGKPSVLWKLDMAEELGVFVHPRVMGWTGANSVALLDRWIYVNTDNGVDWTHVNVPFPYSPSLVCVDARTGARVWQNSTIHRSISSVVATEATVYACDFSGFVYGLAAATGKVQWRLDVEAHLWSSPVLVGNWLYLGDEDADATVIDLERMAARVRGATEPLYLKKRSLAPNSAGTRSGATAEGPLAHVNSMASQAPLHATPAYANGVLYWNIGGYLCAITAPAKVLGGTRLLPSQLGRDADPARQEPRPSGFNAPENGGNAQDASPKPARLASAAAGPTACPVEARGAGAVPRVRHSQRPAGPDRSDDLNRRPGGGGDPRVAGAAETSPAVSLSPSTGQLTRRLEKLRTEHARLRREALAMADRYRVQRGTGSL